MEDDNISKNKEFQTSTISGSYFNSIDKVINENKIKNVFAKQSNKTNQTNKDNKSITLKKSLTESQIDNEIKNIERNNIILSRAVFYTFIENSRYYHLSQLILNIKHNSIEAYFQRIIINNLLWSKKSHLISCFNDQLIYNNSKEFINT